MGRVGDPVAELLPEMFIIIIIIIIINFPLEGFEGNLALLDIFICLPGD